MKHLCLIILCTGLIHLHLLAQISHALRPTDAITQDLFGRAVDISGNFAIVGAHGHDYPMQSVSNAGAAYIYRFNGKRWVFNQKIAPAYKKSNMHFGYSVAIDGHIAVIGAVSDEGLNAESGAAYIFTFNGSSWTETKKIQAFDGQTLDFYGLSVDIDGAKIIVGAPYKDFFANRTGAVYFYEHDGLDWIDKQKVVPSDSISGGFYGKSVSISGNRAIVGAPIYPNPVNAPGQAYVLEYNGFSWQEQHIIKPTDGNIHDNFGHAVGMDNDQIIVTSPFLSGTSFAPAAAYFFNYIGTSWVQHQKVVSSFYPNSGDYGMHAAIEGNIAVIGAHLDNDGIDRGAAYVYKKQQNGLWTASPKVKGSDFSDINGPISEFGSPIAISGTKCIAGALDTTQTQSDEGLAFVVELARPENDQFSASKPIHCGDTIDVSTVFAQHIDPPDTCTIGFPQTPGLWYTFTGTGDNINARLCGSNLDTRIAVYRPDDVDDVVMKCVSGNDDVCNFQSSVVFSTIPGIFYFIYVSAADNTLGNYHITIDCSQASCSAAPVAFTDNIGLNSARINWNPVPGALMYEITGSVLGGLEKSFNLPAVLTQFTVNGLIPGVTYQWKVRAICDQSNTTSSPFSNIEIFTTPDFCPSPNTIWSTAITNTSARLNWIPIPDASWYRIFGSLVGYPNAQWNLDVIDPTVTYLDVSGIAQGASYRWTIVSRCGPNVSIAEVFDTFTTPVLFQPNKSSTEIRPDNEINVYPNPASDQLSMYLNPEAIGHQLQWLIYDMAGNIVFKKSLMVSEINITEYLPSTLINGVYQLHFVLAGAHYSEKLVIIK